MLKKTREFLRLNKKRDWIVILVDLVILTLSYVTAVLVAEFKKTGFSDTIIKRALNVYALLVFLYFLTLWLSGSFKVMWRYASVSEYLVLIISSVIPAILFAVIDRYAIGPENGLNRPLIYLLSELFFIISSVLVRVFYSFIYLRIKDTNKTTCCKKNVLLIGAGKTSKIIIDELKRNISEYNPICILDDDESLTNKSLNGLPIIGKTDDINKVLIDKKIDTVIVAVPSMKQDRLKNILNVCVENKCSVKVLPQVSDIISNIELMKQAREVNIADLLGRSSIDFDLKDIKTYLKNKTILVTGGGGTIGSELSRQIAKCNVKKLVLVDNYENCLYDVEQELKSKYENLKFSVEVINVVDYDRMDLLFKECKFDIVFHAAAHKHVPLMETNPESAVKNNIIGTLNTVKLSTKHNVDKFILISTDKAVNPTNFMGATKRLCEMIIQQQAQDNKGNKKTQFAAVRFGNVLGSNGSVIPLFKNQILAGGPVKVTHKEIIRYFMTIKEAVLLILEASTFAKNGEIFILDMGEPVKILSLAEKMIKLMGFKPYEEIKIEFIGLRPGEKLYEELLIAEEGLKKTQNGKIFVAKQVKIDSDKLDDDIDRLIKAAHSNVKKDIIKIMKEVVDTYKPNKNN